jgi:hypothetical protein
MADLPGIVFGTGAGAIKWPTAAYMISLGVSPSIAHQLGGKSIDMTGLSKTPANYVRAITQALPEQDAASFWSPWTRQGFDYTAYTSSDSKVKSAFKRQADAFFPDVFHQGWEKTDPTIYTFTDRGAKKQPTQVVTPTGQTVVGGDAKGTSAYSIMAQNLTNWGMEDLIPKVYDYVFNKGVTDGRQLLNAIRTEPEYKKTFVGLDQHNRTNPQPLTEAQYLSLAQRYRETADMYGLPSSFFTRQEVGQLIAGGVSAAEFNRRLANGYQVAMSADDATKKYLAQQGVDMGHLLAYYLDPKKAEPILTQKATTAQLQGYAQNVGVKDFTTAMAQELAKRAKSAINSDGTFSSAQEQRALDVAGAGAGLTGAAPGSNAPTVDTTQLIGSQLQGFGGTTQPEAQLAVQRAAQGQAAPFQGGGGYEATQRGVTGVASAQQ